MHGFGEKTVLNKTRYVGGFKDHEFWGCGTWWTAEGKKYEGGYRDQKCHGFVTVTEVGATEGKELFYKDDVVSTPPAPVQQIMPSFELVIGLVGAVFRGDAVHTTQGFISWPGGYYDGALDGGFHMDTVLRYLSQQQPAKCNNGMKEVGNSVRP